MPGFDGTGPLGLGPGTGRGLGPCFSLGLTRPRSGAAFSRWPGRSFGRGLGWRQWFRFAYRQPTRSEEISDIKSYIQDLKAELKEAEKYLEDLEAKK